jgi:hypothetical protein
MTGGGKMHPHIHADGCLSGVYYVEVPAVVRDPAAGQVTFPSYLWHDTVPLPEANTERRLCLAFDPHPR